MAINLFGFFRGGATETGLSPVYQANRRAYNERYSIHEQNARWWRAIAIGCIGVAGLAVGGLVYDDSQSKYTPYVVERDHLGDGIAIGPAVAASAADPRVIQAEINRWIHDVRAVSSDAQTQRDNINEAYAHTDKSCPAFGELNDWFTTPPNPPWERAKTELVTTTISSTMPRAANHWKDWVSKWTEETRTRAGDLIGPPQIKEISITVVNKPPSTDAEFHTNQSGVFVCEFDWKN